MTNATSLELYFGNSDTPGLYRTVFHAPGYDSPIIGVRGPLFLSPSLPFIWSTSCMALSLLFVNAVIKEASGIHPVLPLLEGGLSSPAGTIGRLLNKGIRSWLHDIFGADSSGRPLLNRIVLLGNARGRRHGPITATLRSSYLAPSDIRIFVDGEDISKNVVALEELSKKLLKEFSNRKDTRLNRASRSPQTQTPAVCAA
jgi:hypothetical protein